MICDNWNKRQLTVCDKARNTDIHAKDDVVAYEIHPYVICSHVKVLNFFNKRENVDLSFIYIMNLLKIVFSR